MSPDQLARAESALSEGDVETALDALIAFAERRAHEPSVPGTDERFDFLFQTTMEIATL